VSLLGGIETEMLAWFAGFGLLGLALMSFSEAIIQPIPPDLLLLAMLLTSDSPSYAFLLWLVITLASVAGSVGGYFLGVKAGRPLLDRFTTEKKVKRLENLLERYGTLGIFIAAASPIPYKVFAWVAGMGRMEMRPFLLAGLLGRGLRFGLLTLLVGIMGEDLLRLMEQEWLLIPLILAAVPLAWLAHRWWSSLLEEE